MEPRKKRKNQWKRQRLQITARKKTITMKNTTKRKAKTRRRVTKMKNLKLIMKLIRSSQPSTPSCSRNATK